MGLYIILCLGYHCIVWWVKKVCGCACDVNMTEQGLSDIRLYEIIICNTFFINIHLSMLYLVSWHRYHN